MRILKDEGSICWQVGTYVKKGFEIVKEYVSIAKKRLKQLKEGNLPYRKIFSPIKIITGNSKLLFRKK